MSDSDGELDLTSDPMDDILATPPPSLPRTSGKQRSTNKSVRIFFICCRIYTRLPVPEKVQTGELKSWRVHCVRCGRMAEISV